MEDLHEEETIHFYLNNFWKRLGFKDEIKKLKREKFTNSAIYTINKFEQTWSVYKNEEKI